jgi:outer membrane protein assembly factor BamB
MFIAFINQTWYYASVGRNLIAHTISSRLGAIVAISALAAVGCNARPQALPNMDLPAANGIELRGAGSNDDWTTFAHDNERSGFNPAVTRLTRSTVSGLRLRWKRNISDEIFASPVIYDGNLIVVSEGSKKGRPGSVVYDFATSDGRLLWKFAMGAEAQMTPAIDPDADLVIVGNEEKRHRRSNPSYVFALRLVDGSLVWRRPVYALLRAAPVVAGGSVYVGRAGGDPPSCVRGGVTAINESTGKVDWSWSVDPKPDEGGSVWGAIAYDGTHLIFGTGNTCKTPIPTANGAVSLNLDGKPAWSMVAVKDALYDSDTGGGVLLFHGRAHFINKNGLFYALDKETGNIAWSTDLNPYVHRPYWRGGVASPTTDGTTIVEGSGLYQNSGSDDGGEFCELTAAKPGEVFAGFHSKLQGINLSGHVLWARDMQNRLVGYVALAQGLGFAGLNKDFVALDLSTGKTLWSHQTPYYIDASMVVVPSGVYGADDGGNIYAFALRKSSRIR